MKLKIFKSQFKSPFFEVTIHLLTTLAKFHLRGPILDVTRVSDCNARKQVDQEKLRS